MAHSILFDLGLVLTLAFFAAILVKKLGLSVIIGYMAVGLAIGPYGLKLIENVEFLENFSEIGVVLLMFFLGIEFSISKFRQIKKKVIFIGTYEVVFNLISGFLLSLLIGLLIGITWREKLFFACIIALSSSGVVAKLLFDLKRTADPETEILMGVMIFEDFFAVVLLGVMSSLALSSQIDFTQLGFLLLKVFLFFVIFLLMGKFVIHRLIDYLSAIESQELFTALIIGVVLLSGALANLFGLSAAAGSFLLGMIITSYDVEQRLHRTVAAFRDIFLTVFFISFGMLLNLKSLPAVIDIVLISTVASIIFEIIISSSGAFFSGMTSKASFTIGTSMIARGEYSLIFATLGLSTGVISDDLYQFTGLYVLSMILIAPIVMRNAHHVHNGIRFITPKWTRKLLYKLNPTKESPNS